MTLRELCGVCGVSRRAVQGYEKSGLVRASGRNNRGYLIYDAAAQEQIRMIRMYQRFGFQVKEIKVLLSLPVKARRERLIEQKAALEKERTEMDGILALITEVISSMDETVNA